MRDRTGKHLSKDISFRKWATAHGGVYVHPDEHTPPNPYLKVPDRDILSSKGKALTLMNPAYMLRQMQSDFPGEYGTRSHITSLKPLNPQLRMMLPFIVEQCCLKCHEQQGYKLGNVRGGIGTVISLTPYLKREQEFSASLMLSHGAIWLASDRRQQTPCASSTMNSGSAGPHDRGG